MRGPDFEIPPLEPPAPPVDGPVAERTPAPTARRLAAAAVAGVLAVSGAAFAGYSWQSESPAPVAVPVPSTTEITERPQPTTSSTRLTTTTRATSSARTCLDSPDNPAAAAGASPEGFPWITFKVSPRAGRDALDRMARAAAQAREAFGDAGAVGVRVYCEVQELATASNTPPDEVQKRVTEGEIAFFRDGDMWIYGPNFEKEAAVTERQVVYHEYFHALQRSLSRTRSAIRGATPLWLIEGGAKYFENTVTPRELENFRRDHIRRYDERATLDALEQSGEATIIGGTGDAYAVGAVAVDYLVRTYGRERIQTDFWVALGRTGWRAAFLEVFGVAVDTFYSDFATYRQTLRP